MKHTVLERLFAIVLAMTMCVSLLPISAAAEENTAVELEPTTEAVSAPVPESSTETTPPASPLPEVEATSAAVRVTFVCEPTGAKITIWDAEGEELSSEEDGSYQLVPGKYTYTASCEGYVSAENVELVIESGAEIKEVSVSLEAEAQDNNEAKASSALNDTAAEIAAVQSSDIIASGECGAEGSNLTWLLDKNGVLTISGTGAMKNYGVGSQTPWADYVAQIKEIVINSGVTTIGGYTFSCCNALTSVTIPASVTKIGDAICNVFDGCTSLVSINVDAQNQSFTSKDGILYDKAMQKLLACPAGKTGVLAIPDGVTLVAASAAIGCTKLTDVTLPSSVTSIGFHAFQGCRGLTKLTIPASVDSIGVCAFNRCDSLTEIEFCHSEYAALKFETLGTLKSNAFYSNNTNFATTVKVPDNNNVNPAISGYDWAGDNRNPITYESTCISLPDSDIIDFGTFGADGDNLKWEFNLSTGVLTISGTGTIESKIPENMPWTSHATQIGEIVIEDGVTAIGSGAFSGGASYDFCYVFSGNEYSNLTKITIADSVTTIGAAAFYGCSALTSVTIPRNVVEIGDFAFFGCYNLADISVDAANQYYTSEDGVLYNKAKTELIKFPSTKDSTFSIPNGVMTIKCGAFAGCRDVTTVTIPASVTTIEQSAFSGCKGLKNVIIPNGVTTIGTNAFAGCSALERLDIPASVTDIGDENSSYYSDFVNGCTTLSNIDVDSANAKFASKDGVVYNKELTELLIYPQGRIGDFVIPDGVMKIGKGAFVSWSPYAIVRRNLTRVTIPSSVENIGMCAFGGCAELTQLTIPASVTSINDGAFMNCNSLVQIEFCHSKDAALKFETLGAFCSNAFYSNNTNLATTVKVPDANNINPAISGYDWAGDNRTVAYKSSGDSAATDIIASGECGAEGSNLTWSLDKNGVLTISGTGAMKEYSLSEQAPWRSHSTQITSVIIENGVTSVGSFAFAYCDKFSSIDISDSVTCIGLNAFLDCTDLTSLTIPAGVERIAADTVGFNAFLGCSSLVSINVDTQNQNFTSNDGILYDKAMKTLIACPSGKTGELVIPSGVTVLNASSVSGCSKLTAVTIPSSVTTIKSSAFHSCGGLIYVTIPNGVITIGTSAFQGCSSLKSVTISASVASIGHCAFSQCDNLTEIEFCHAKDATLKFETLGTLGFHAFYSNNTQLATTVIVPDTNNINSAISGYDWAGDNRTVTYKSASDSPRHAPNMYVDWITGNAYDVISVDWCCDKDANNTYWAVHNWDGGYAGFQNKDGQHVLLLSLWDLADGTSPTIEYSLNGENGSFGGEGTGKQVFTNYDWQVGKWYTMCIQVSSDNDKSYYTQYVKEENGDWLKTAVISYPITGNKFFGSSVFQEDFTFNNLMRSCRLRNASGRIYGTDTWESWNNCKISNSFFPTDSTTWESGVQLNIDFDCNWDNHGDYIWVQSGGEGFDSNEKQIPVEYSLSNSDIPAKSLFDKQDSFSEKVSVNLNEIAADKAASGGFVAIDMNGKVFAADENGSFGAIELGNSETVLAAVSGYNVSDSADVHTMYPTSMEVYLLSDEDGEAKIQHISEFDDLLRYSGCSIRITGKKGIRMITSVDGALKSSLINGGVAGYTLEEYGTLLCFSNEMVNGSLCLDDSYARHNYAYSRAAGADPVFKYSGSMIQYTNVLVGFNLEQCTEDIAMRPYIVLSDAQGNRHTVYGGIVYRSIGYIAYQNRNAFSPTDPAYDYIWDIIHHVYGDKYDAEYKK